MGVRFRNSTRFDKVVEVAAKAVNALGSTQKFGVVAFDLGLVWADDGDLKLASPLTKQTAIDGRLALQSNGGANYEAGLQYASNLATKLSQNIFLSDGLPNQRNYLDELYAVIAKGIKVNTIGVGNGASSSLSSGTFTPISHTAFQDPLKAPKFSVGGNSYDWVVWTARARPRPRPTSDPSPCRRRTGNPSCPNGGEMRGST